MCHQLITIWQRLNEDLGPIGVGLATINYDSEIELANKLGGSRGELPHLVLVMDGKITQYKDEQFSVVKVIGSFTFLVIQFSIIYSTYLT